MLVQKNQFLQVHNLSFINGVKHILPDQINITQGNVNFCNDQKSATDNNKIIIRIKSKQINNLGL